MAKTKTTGKTTAAGPVAGRTFAFVGDLGYYQHPSMFAAAVAEAGGKVVDAEKVVPDCLVIGSGRGGKAPGAATALLKKHPAIQSYDVPAFCRLIYPTRDELLDRIRSGAMERSPKGSNHGNHWDVLEALNRLAQSSIDLSGVSLRGVRLWGAHLEGTKLDGADLRETNLEFAHMPPLRGAKLDSAKMPKIYLQGAEDCSFRNAVMDEAWFYDVHRWNQTFHYSKCDFSGAKIPKARGDRASFTGTLFRKADLSEASFEQTDFTGADFSNAILKQTHFLKANLTGAKFAGANGQRVDLRETKLVNADLRKADFRDAVFIGADLTGAQVDGADFTGANFTGATLNGVDTSKAKNLAVKQARTAGPKMKELAKVAAASASLETKVELDLGNGERVVLHASGRTHGNRFHPEARSSFLTAEAKWGQNESYTVNSFEQGMLAGAQRWSRGTVQLDTVTATGGKCPMKGNALRELAVAAWSEACGIDAADLATKAQADASARGSMQDAMLSELKGGAAGVANWNARPKHERIKIAKVRPLDLAGCDLRGADFEDCDLSRANLRGADLRKAELKYGKWDKANFGEADFRGATFQSGEARGATFENAKMTGCSLEGLSLRNADFRGVDLSKSTMRFVDLHGADLSTATLGASMEHVGFDDKTILPKGFEPPLAMEWKGPGPHPALAKSAPKAKKAGAMTFDGFLAALANHVHAAKLQKATSMLKAERFQLFAEVKDDSLVGVVKSQSDKDLVYSCRLASDGGFGCCTQNLKPCGGLQGSLCKHLIVLIVGLAKAGQIDAAIADNWINASKLQKPAIDKDAMSETFLRYKGAEAGEIDWRPTETIPEDFYAM